ncbi:VCP-like ATPase [uncultured archaeon]|nr:VCP-like ATPase [uncultured archaeon]
MAEMRQKQVVMRVDEPDPSHVGRNIITLDRSTKDALGVTSGDIVEIAGQQHTAATIWPARNEDEGRGLIRMDNLIRHNAGVGLGDKVTVRKAEYSEAKKVVLAPIQEVRIIASGYDRILKKNFIGRPLNKGDQVMISVFGSGFIYQVVDTVPRGIVKVTDSTQFMLREEPIKDGISGIPRVSYEDIGGLEGQVQKVREMIELPMKHPEIFRRLGISPPKGVLLYGPPGTGKTLLAKAVANETQAHFIPVSSPSIMGKFVGEAEERIREVFKEAEKNAPSIIFFDEIDSIAPKRDEVVGEVERRVVAQILSAMDGMEARGQVIVIGATNRINSIDEALRRPGRFDREIEIGVPSKAGRLEIFHIHSRGMPLSKDVDLDYFAGITHGFVGADIEALAKEAAIKALRRYLPRINLEEETIPQEVLESLEVTREDFSEALKGVQPSALREVAIEVPNVKWSDIGGLEELKKELKQAVEWPLKNPGAFQKMGIRPPRGVLLYGPPGCGKTAIAKAIATESEANFISIKGPQLLSMWIGESEKGVRKIFQRARQVSPVVVFFDEIDSIAAHRGMMGDSGVNERMVNQLLTELDGIEEMKGVVFICATNRPDLLDPALLRPGRIDKILRVPAPDLNGRRVILKIHSKNVPLSKNVSLEDVAKRTEGYSGADLEGLVREASLIALQESGFKPCEVRVQHIEEAMKKITPTISKETSDAYDQFKNSVVQAFRPSYVR